MGFKDQNVVFGCSFEQILFWERKRGEKGERARAWEKIKFCVIPSHFLLLRDQATYKRRFEEI